MCEPINENSHLVLMFPASDNNRFGSWIAFSISMYHIKLWAVYIGSTCHACFRWLIQFWTVCCVPTVNSKRRPRIYTSLTRMTMREFVCCCFVCHSVYPKTKNFLSMFHFPQRNYYTFLIGFSPSQREHIRERERKFRFIVDKKGKKNNRKTTTEFHLLDRKI